MTPMKKRGLRVANLLRKSLARRTPTIRRYDGVDFDAVDPLDYSFNFAGVSYTGYPGRMGVSSERIEANFLGVVQGAYKRNGVIFACERARLSVFSEARFMFRRITDGRPGELFSTPELGLLENPWPNATTGDLLTRLLQDADMAGNAFWCVRNGHLRRMRPDWVTIVIGSNSDPQIIPDDLDSELLGYGYWPGGVLGGKEPVFLLPEEVAHFAPTPDPVANFRGMSWITPIVRELEADIAATIHKLAFFENGATLQTVISLDKEIKEEAFERLVAKMNLAHRGSSNAYKTLVVGGGADVNVVGADLKQLDFKATQGAGESRIAAAAGVHPVIVGLSEGLQGSSLNAGNFGQARRLFAEGTLSTLWRNVCASLATLIDVPADAELWYDTRDIPFLREDRKDQSNIQREESATISSLITAGFTPKSSIAAVKAQDWTLLEHTGLFSVQLQPPGQGQMPGGTTPIVGVPATTPQATTPAPTNGKGA